MALSDVRSVTCSESLVPVPDADLPAPVFKHEPVQEAQERLLEAGHLLPGADLYLYRLDGCELCGGKGYKGCMGIYETLENSAELKQLIQTRAATNRIFDQAIASRTET